MKKHVVCMLLTAACAIVLTACGGGTNTQQPATQETTEAEATEETTEAEAPAGAADVEVIISMAPSVTHILIDLGLADKIVAVDSYSQMTYGEYFAADIPVFDMMNPDNEALVAMAPDVIFTTGMSAAGGTDVFASVREAGTNIIDIESEHTIDEIMANLQMIGDSVGKGAEAKEFVDEMRASVEELKAIGESIPEEERKTVFYEFSTPTPDFPQIYTCGKNTYISEMLSVIGAVNIGDEHAEDWITYSEEEAVAANPDVIMTTDNYTPDVINVILTMEGWENVAAVQNKEVYLPDPDTVNQPNHHIVSAMIEMGQMLYPDYYADVVDPFEEALDNAA
ncbi:MAG: ABC transporter substrate-binding protein [Lachnospiraceae bacterium]|nr:ABC transporter substrate-binding protein [Lachnospiraceae bacterium]